MKYKYRIVERGSKYEIQMRAYGLASLFGWTRIGFQDQLANARALCKIFVVDDYEKTKKTKVIEEFLPCQAPLAQVVSIVKK